MIPLSVPLITGNEWQYVKDCLDTGWISSAGSYVSKFEQIFIDYIGAKYAVAVINGTSALHLSLLSCSVCQGDEVLVPTLTFIAPVNTIKYCGAEPVFIDCDDTLGLNPQKLKQFINENTFLEDDGFRYNKKTNRRIKAIIPVHVFGHPCKMEDINNICRPNNIHVIEDATESLGSEYNGNKTGLLGTVGCFSFNGNKLITTGGGGMIVTNNSAIAENIRHLSTQAKKDGMEYDHDSVGYNYRLNNVQAAIGVAQMERLDEFIDIKRKNANLYKELLSDIDNIDFLTEKDFVKSNFWFYTIKVSKEIKNKLIEFLISKDIQVRPIWKLIHSLPMYSKNEAYNIDYAQHIYDTCINIPCSLDLKRSDIEYVTDCIKEFLNKS